jgi:hypothetical protein
MRVTLSSVRATQATHASRYKPRLIYRYIHQNGQRCPCRSVAQQQHALGIVAETDGVQREHDEAVVQISFAHELTLPPAFPPSLTPACGPIRAAPRIPYRTIPPRVQIANQWSYLQNVLRCFSGPWRLFACGSSRASCGALEQNAFLHHEGCCNRGAVINTHRSIIFPTPTPAPPTL